MPDMAIDRGRELQGRKQVVVFRATGGESVWMDVLDAKQLVARLPAEWSKDPFGGQTYGVAKDPWEVEALRGGVTAIERPWGY